MRILSPATVDQLLASIPERSPFGARDRALIIFDLHTGLRSHELVALNVGHVLTRDGSPREWLEVIDKGGFHRQVPLNAAARQAILDLVQFNQSRGFSVAPESPLLVTRCHRRLPTRSLRDIIQRHREWADLDVRCSPHTLRHTFASRLAACAPLPVVQVALGHARLSSTQVYTHTTPAQLVARCCPPGRGLIVMRSMKVDTKYCIKVLSEH